MRQSLLDRIDKSDDCWLWTGVINNCGYGHLGSRVAHRLVYEETVGPIPEGMVLDHLCRVRHCVNPAHLEAVTHAENMRRSAPARKTHCKHGHAFDAANTYHRKKDGQRGCRACQRESTRKYQLRRLAA